MPSPTRRGCGLGVVFQQPVRARRATYSCTQCAGSVPVRTSTRFCRYRHLLLLLLGGGVARETEIYDLLQQIEPERRALRKSNHRDQQAGALQQPSGAVTRKLAVGPTG